MGSHTIAFDTANAIEDEEASAAKPDYILDLTDAVPPDVDLLRIRVSTAYNTFCLLDPSSRSLQPSSLWMVSLLDWTDLNGDGRMWEDANANGAVNFGELQEGELNRFMIGNPWSDVVEVSARRPMARIHNGLFLGLHHTVKRPEIPITRLNVELEFYRQTDWDWLSISSRKLVLAPGETGKIRVKLQPPPSAVPGVYAGSLAAWDDSGFQVNVPIPVVVGVDRGISSPHPSVVRGTDGVGDTLDNGRMFGAFDWGWREESGDWRFYFVNVPPFNPSINSGLRTRPFEELSTHDSDAWMGWGSNAASYILSNARWPDMPADTDILLYRPDPDDFFSSQMPEVFGPYGLTLSGSSRRTHSFAGMWPFDTATGGPSEWVAGRALPGLNLIQLHNVLSSGLGGSQPIDLRAGTIWLQPGKIDLVPGQTSAQLQLSSSMSLPGLSALAFGFASPQHFPNQPISQNVVAEPNTASYWKDIEVSGAGFLDIATASDSPIDVDLYVLYDANRDGLFDWTYEVLAVSGTTSASEHIRLMRPNDGRYRIAIHGYRVPKPATFDLTLTIPDRRDLTVVRPAGPVRRGRPETLLLTFPPAPPGASGIVFLGPPEAAVIPVELSVN